MLLPRKALRIVVLHQHYWPEIAATAQILTDLCEDLSVLGHEVHVVCGQPSYHSASRHSRLPAHEEHRGVHVHRVWSVLPSRRSIPQRLAQYGSYFATSLLATLQLPKPDVCLVMSTPPLLLGLSGVLLELFRGVPFVYSVQDLYPDIAVHVGVLGQDTAAYGIIDQISRALYRRAAHVVTLSGAMAERLHAKGVAPERVEVIANWADTDHVVPTARDNEFARSHGLSDEFVVQYAGNLGLSQGLEHLVEAASALESDRVLFALIGEGNARDALERTTRERNLGNLRFFPPQPRAQLGAVLSSCDLGLVTMKRGVAADLVPSKLYGIMAAARPVLACVEPSSEVARVVRECDCGITVPPEDSAALIAAVRAARALTHAERAAMGQRGREAARTRYGRPNQTARYAESLERVARGNVTRP